jgi:DNA-directed RNA polymerase sigma subunit (sigma70/sigma32)
MIRLLFLLTPAIFPIGWPQLDAVCEPLRQLINRLVRTSRQMLTEIGREPTPDELAEKLAMPLEKVLRVLKIAKQPISLEAPIGGAGCHNLG